MNLLDRIRAAIHTRPSDDILCFGSYTIDEQCGVGFGYEGTVFRVQNPIRKTFALKLYEPNPLRPYDGKVLQRLQNELKTLSTLKHRNIVGVVTGGKATFQNGKWKLFETLEPIGKLDENTVHFYIMDYYEVNLGQIFPQSASDDKVKYPNAVSPKFAKRKSELFRRAVSDVLTAMCFCRNQKEPILHRDIKSPNILYRPDDNCFVLADFGYAKKGPALNATAHLWTNENFDLTSRGMFVENDIWAFCKMASRILPAVQNTLNPGEYSYAAALFDDVLRASPEAFPYSCPKELFDAINNGFVAPRWHLTVDLGGRLQREENPHADISASPTAHTFTKRINLPIWRSVCLTDEICELIDSPEFQRLRGVKQLGPTEFVYPGASHSRFEHSLGVYHLACQYVATLSRSPAFHKQCTPLNKCIGLAVLSSLLHDIGHYPYSHWIEEIKGSIPSTFALLSHEERARAIITKGRIAKVIRKGFGLEPSAVADVIDGSGETRPQRIIQSIINSVIDVDKLDYLIRDSVHCGVDYGFGIEADRICDNITIDERNERICPTRKARTHLLALLTCRNLMYQEVYWHKTVRTCTAMFKRAMFELVRNKKMHLELKRLLELDDAGFITGLRAITEQEQYDHLARLVRPFAYQGRELYKTVYILSSQTPNVVGNMVLRCFPWLRGKVGLS